jgi:hypothetical protein
MKEKISFQIGQRDFVTALNNWAMTLLLIFGSINALIYWRTISNRIEAQQVWAMLGCGLGFYSLGQLVWIYDSLAGIDIP